MKYVHTNIIAIDWKKLSQFYIDVFSCEVLPPQRKQSGDWLSKGTGVPSAELEGVHLLLPGYDRSGPTLEIYQYAKVIDQKFIQANQRGLGHLAFEVENVKEVADKIIAHGGQYNGEITRKYIDGVGEITFVYMRDPEGNLIELQSWNRDV